MHDLNVPMTNPTNTGIIHLWDLPENEVCLVLENQYKEAMLNKAKELAGGKWIYLGPKLGLLISKYHTVEKVRKFIRTGVAKLNLVKKFSDFLVLNGCNDYSLNEIEKKIILIKGKGGNAKPIYKPKFPINFNSKEGAIVISCMFHDGGIDVRNNEPFYSNSSLDLRERFVYAVNNVVGRVDIVSEVKYKQKEVIYPRIFGVILRTIGLVPGKRPINNPKFPDFILNATEEFISEFLSQAIADDGWIYCPKEKFGYIAFNFTIDLTKFSEEKRNIIRKEKPLKYLPNVLLGDKKLFEKIGAKIEGPYFGNEKHYYKNERENRYTQEWRIYIRDLRSLKLLAKKLNIPLSYKQRRLKEISKKERIVARCNPKILRFISNFDKSFTHKELVDLSKFNPRTIWYQLNCFCEDGFLKRVRFRGASNTRFKYVLTEEGKKELELFRS